MKKNKTRILKFWFSCHPMTSSIGKMTTSSTGETRMTTAALTTTTMRTTLLIKGHSSLLRLELKSQSQPNTRMIINRVSLLCGRARPHSKYDPLRKCDPLKFSKIFLKLLYFTVYNPGMYSIRPAGHGPHILQCIIPYMIGKVTLRAIKIHTNL